MNWNQLLSLKRYGDTQKRLRSEQDETRLGFEVDYDRIIFSDSFRSLQDKTQVIPLSKTDFVHTRLTHSLEVSVAARSLGRIVGEKILKKYPELTNFGYKMNDFGAIVATAALAHDIGNPPFGHSGEKAIGEYFINGNGKKYKEQLTDKQWQDLIDFEGNANGFRILTETKELSEELGLISTGTNGNTAFKRHPLAYLVEAADDICYTIIDFEDGINLGLIEEEFALEYLIKLVKDTINSEKYYQLKHKKDRLSYLRALAIGTLITEASNIFLENEEAILNGSYPYSLLEKCKYEAQINDIIKLSVEKIYKSREVIEKELMGYSIITKLLDVFLTATNNKFENTLSNYDKLVLNLLPEHLQTPNKKLYIRVLNICGFVASLTDGFALQLYKKING